MSRPRFSYLAYDLEGRSLRGSEEGGSEAEVVAALAGRGLTAVRIEPEGGSLLLAPLQLAGLRRAGSRRDLIDFTEALSTLLAARIPMDRALSLLEELTEDDHFRRLVCALGREVRGGKSLAGAMALFPEDFSPLYLSMIRAGEEGGILELLLPRLLGFLAAGEDTRNRVMSALIYPAILILVGLGSVLLLLMVVVPRFATIFEGTGAAVPVAAALLLAAGRGLRDWAWLCLLLPPLSWYGWAWLTADPARRLALDRRLLGLPLVGEALRLLAASAFSKTLGALLAAGIPLIRALAIGRGVVANRSLAGLLVRVEEEVRGGRSLGRALAEAGGFPKILAQLVLVGEESGETAAILSRIGEHFERRARQRIDRLVALLEPVLILSLGILIGGIVLVMLSAVFSLNDLGRG